MNRICVFLIPFAFSCAHDGPAAVAPAEAKQIHLKVTTPSLPAALRECVSVDNTGPSNILQCGPLRLASIYIGASSAMTQKNLAAGSQYLRPSAELTQQASALAQGIMPWAAGALTSSPDHPDVIIPALFVGDTHEHYLLTCTDAETPLTMTSNCRAILPAFFRAVLDGSAHAPLTASLDAQRWEQRDVSREWKSQGLALRLFRTPNPFGAKAVDGFSVLLEKGAITHDLPEVFAALDVADLIDAGHVVAHGFTHAGEHGIATGLDVYFGDDRATYAAVCVDVVPLCHDERACSVAPACLRAVAGAIRMTLVEKR
jgi:hypothetical protein